MEFLDFGEVVFNQMPPAIGQKAWWRRQASLLFQTNQKILLVSGTKEITNGRA
jgi:hypothetical protein